MIEKFLDLEGLQYYHFKNEQLLQDKISDIIVGEIECDTELSDTSEKPVQNKVIKSEFDALKDGTTTVGNALKLNGLTAEEFQQTNDVRDIGDLFSSITTPTDIRDIMYNLPSGHYICSSGTHPNVILPFEDNVGIQVDWERLKNPDNGLYYGTLTMRSMINNSQWVTCSVYNNSSYTEWEYPSTKADLANYLPLTGGMLKDSLSLNDGWANIGGEPNSAYLIASNTQGDLDNTRMLIMFNKNYMGDTANALQIWEKINGLTSVQHTVLHSGNVVDYALPKSGGSLNTNAIIKMTAHPTGITGFDFINDGESTHSAGIGYTNNPTNGDAHLYLGVNIAAAVPTNNALAIYANSIKWADKEILHTGNYSSYALPKHDPFLDVATSVNLTLHNSENAIGSFFYNNSDRQRNGGIGVYGDAGTPQRLFLSVGQGASPWDTSYGLNIYPDSIDWKGNALIHAGNIGNYTAGAANYIHWNNIDGKPTIMTANGITPAGVDIDSVKTNGSYYVSTDTTGNRPGNYGEMLVMHNVDTLAQVYVPYSTSDGTLRYRGGTDGGGFYSWRSVLDETNYNNYAPTLTGAGASGTWGINITGNAATATFASYLSYLKNTSTDNVGVDDTTSNAIGYVHEINLFNQIDGALYKQVYSDLWAHEIYGDYRTGQLAVRGKNNGTWQAWRTIIDSENIGSQSVNYANSSGTSSHANLANYSNQLQAFTGDDFTGGDHFVKAIRGNGWDTHLYMCYNNGGMQADSVSVNYANSAGHANTSVYADHSHLMRTYSADGGSHGSGWLLKCQHNVKGNGHFDFVCGDGSIGVQVDRAVNSTYADSAGSISNQGSAATKDIVTTTSDPGAGASTSYKEGSIICVYE